MAITNTDTISTRYILPKIQPSRVGLGPWVVEYRVVCSSILKKLI